MENKTSGTEIAKQKTETKISEQPYGIQLFETCIKTRFLEHCITHTVVAMTKGTKILQDQINET